MMFIRNCGVNIELEHIYLVVTDTRNGKHLTYTLSYIEVRALNEHALSLADVFEEMYDTLENRLQLTYDISVGNVKVPGWRRKKKA
jgi:hypothetical protein